jgi:hypothetical protein
MSAIPVPLRPPHSADAFQRENMLLDEIRPRASALGERPGRQRGSAQAAMRCAMRRAALIVSLLVTGAPALCGRTEAAPPAKLGGKPRSAPSQKTTAETKPRKKPAPSPSPAKQPNSPRPGAAPAQEEPKQKLAPLPPPDTSSPPPLLPAAPRERMQECADEWSRMKMETHGQLPMWRNFAAKCLTR